MNAPATTEPPLLLEAERIGKAYAAPVLEGVTLRLAAGEVHALLGSNGAGKSTLAAIIGGMVRPDGGRLSLAGVPWAPASRAAAEQGGVVTVLQELDLLPTLSVAENLFLDRLPHRFGVVRTGELRRRATAALARVGLGELPPNTALRRLGVGERQLVEIARALDRRCRLLILDEPTAALSSRETEILFDNVRRLRADGVAILLVTHRLDELPRIADRTSVLRDGRVVATYAGGDAPTGRLIRDMVGHDPAAVASAAASDPGPTALAVDRLAAGRRLRGATLEVRRGEVVGLFGLVGSGRTELLRAIVGADRASGGTVRVGTGPARRFASPALALAAGIGMLPEDRRLDGLLLPLSVRVNATLATLARHARGGWVDGRSEREAAESIRNRLDVRCVGVEQPIVRLSGGNQQKVILGRWLDTGCDVLLCDEPTRGVDAAAKATIHARLRAFAAAGGAVLLASGELAELRAACDRVLVMAEGEIVAELDRHWTDEEATAAAFGVLRRVGAGEGIR